MSAERTLAAGGMLAAPPRLDGCSLWNCNFVSAGAWVPLRRVRINFGYLESSTRVVMAYPVSSSSGGMKGRVIGGAGSALVQRGAMQLASEGIYEKDDAV